MLPDPRDTIVALSSAAGAGGRAVVRLSGPASLEIARSVFSATEEIDSGRRVLSVGSMQLSGLSSPLPADIYYWPSPRTYTGQELVELHLVSCPPLVDLLVSRLLAAGARAAAPGEFTLRAFLAGKLDLPRAEAVLAVIEAGSRGELKEALAQLTGGVTRPLETLRSDLLDLLADVEARLDFGEDDVEPISQAELLQRLTKGLALVTLLKRQLDQRAISDHPFRVVLAGPPNVGKSSLFNALGGTPAALVSAQPGTTRDYLVRQIRMKGAQIELVDTAGWQVATSSIDAHAQRFAREQTEHADLILLCLEGGRQPESPNVGSSTALQSLPVIVVATKCDLSTPSTGALATSAVTGQGLDTLRALLAERARNNSQPALALSLGRCRHHVDACLQNLRQAHGSVLEEDPPEILAFALREAVEQLGEMVGAVHTDDLLDRIFSRFCIGK